MNSPAFSPEASLKINVRSASVAASEGEALYAISNIEAINNPHSLYIAGGLALETAFRTEDTTLRENLIARAEYNWQETLAGKNILDQPADPIKAKAALYLAHSGLYKATLLEGRIADRTTLKDAYMQTIDISRMQLHRLGELHNGAQTRIIDGFRSNIVRASVLLLANRYALQNHTPPFIAVPSFYSQAAETYARPSGQFREWHVSVFAVGSEAITEPQHRLQVKKIKNAESENNKPDKGVVPIYLFDDLAVFEDGSRKQIRTIPSECYQEQGGEKKSVVKRLDARTRQLLKKVDLSKAA